MAEVSANKDVVIVTHEDFFGNFMEQYLAVFFMELQVRLEIVSLLKDMQAYGWTSGSPEKLILSREPYIKMIVNNTEMLKSVAADLMIVFGHGLERIKNQPSAVCFAPRDATSVSSSECLWGSRYRVEKNQDGSRDKLPGTITTLADVTARSKLAIVLSCRGNQILEDFLSDDPTNFTDMLLCDKEVIDNQSFCIFFVLLVNLIDSDLPRRPLREIQYTYNKSYPKMHEVVKRNIQRIFQIVKKFGTTSESFWGFLEKSGFVSSLWKFKARQGLPNIRRNADLYYRVLGIPWNFELRFKKDGEVEHKKQTILDDFKALKLVRWDAEKKEVVRENWESVFDKPLDVYQKLIPGDTDGASSKKRHRENDLGMLLERLRLSAGVELRRL
jgi:hypothetical protein